MTCIVALRDTEKGTVLVGADSRVSMNGGLVLALPTTTGKLFSISGFVIGSTGPARLRSITSRLKLKIEEKGVNPNFNLVDELLEHIIPAIKRIAKGNGMLHEKEGLVDIGGALLIAIGDQVCVVGSDFNILPIETEFWAIGSGQSLALGSLASTKTYMGAEKRVLKALEVASTFEASVGPPFVCVETKKIRK